MAKTVISIEIGAAAVRMAELVMGKTHQVVRKADIFETPDLVIDDGFIRDSASIAELLKMHIQNTGMTAKEIVFSISSTKVVSREVTVSAAKEKLLKNIVESEAVDYFPMDLTDYTITYAIIGRDPGEGSYRLMVYAAPAALLQQYYDLALELKKEVAAVDFAGNSLFQWFKRSRLSDVSLVVEVNGSSSILTILDHGDMGVQRSIGYGANMIANALLDAQAYDEVKNQADAFKMLQEQTFFGIGDSDDDFWRESEMTRIRTQRFKQIENEIKKPKDTDEAEPAEVSTFSKMSDEEILAKRIEVRNDIGTAARQLINNIRRVIDYYMTKNPESSVQKIYLTGLGAALLGFDSMIAAELQLPTEIYDVTEGILFTRQAATFELKGAEFLSCFGAVIAPLGLRSKDAVNRAKARIYGEIAVGIFAIAVVAFLAVYIKTKVDISNLDKEKKTLEDDIARLLPIEKLEEVYHASQESVVFATETDGMIFTVAEQLNEIIAELEAKLPERSVVSSYSISGEDMLINFTTVTKEEAAKLLLQLKNIPYISETMISGIEEELSEETNRTEVSFSVNCKLQKYVPEEEGEETSDVTETNETEAN